MAAFVNVDAPVGLRWRTQNVKNNAQDQAKVIQLLGAISQSQGGKREVWGTTTFNLSDGVCAKPLADAIWDFQVFWKNKGVFRNIDGVVDPGANTIKKMNELAPASPAPVIEKPFICGPDVTQQIATIWTKIQTDFLSWSFEQKVRACNGIFLPLKLPDLKTFLKTPLNLEELKQKVRQYADINTFDTLPLFQGDSAWLRNPPIFDPMSNGPCATPSSAKPEEGNFDPAHEDPATCSNTVQVAGQCWLNGTVNYGTYGVMVRLCSDFAASHPLLIVQPQIKIIYSLEWAKMLIKAYKQFGANPEAAALPIAWTEATFRGGPRAVPGVSGNRPKCKCACGCRGDVVNWDYVWEPIKTRLSAIHPKAF